MAVCIVRSPRFKGQDEFFDCKFCHKKVLLESSNEELYWRPFKEWLQQWMDFTELSFKPIVAYNVIKLVPLLNPSDAVHVIALLATFVSDIAFFFCSWGCRSESGPFGDRLSWSSTSIVQNKLHGVASP